jgi:hypothetical protein
MRPSIYILRKNNDKIPDRENCSRGDIVVLNSADVLVFTGYSWDLLPGRLITIEELKEFIGYVSSGWPDSVDVAREDLEGRIPPKFLDRMLTTLSKLNGVKQPSNDSTQESF